tara:strand:+ start:666 stop:809 length:144 start_codon:yes stop_codon:yes gene_type:complete
MPTPKTCEGVREGGDAITAIHVWAQINMMVLCGERRREEEREREVGR